MTNLEKDATTVLVGVILDSILTSRFGVGMFDSEIKVPGVVGDMEGDGSVADEDGGENSDRLLREAADGI